MADIAAHTKSAKPQSGAAGQDSQAAAIAAFEKRNRMGPFIVASDLEGNCLFERENEKIRENLEQVYEGTRPAVLKRFGETDDRKDELIG